MDLRSKLSCFSRPSLALSVLAMVFVLLLGEWYYLQKHLLSFYETKESFVLSDRHDKEIAVEKNKNGNYAQYTQEIPSRVQELLLQKEDRYFFYHPGINPWSILQATFYQFGIGDRKASSTITQQLVKILLGNESDRTLHNKITESLYAMALELFQSKETILTMYINSVYFGNQAQGLFAASRTYFSVNPEVLGDNQILQLLATMNHPTGNNPAQAANQQSSFLLANALNISLSPQELQSSKETRQILRKYSTQDKAFFELSSFLPEDRSSCQSAIDLELTQTIRRIVEQNITQLQKKNARNAAVVVIKLPENELLAIIGSPNPTSTQDGYQINMALEPRPIGSTIKPFIYAKAFEKGLRPYTIVDDREYKYTTALGFPLYPQNFDSAYRGEVTLHYALSNSLNVPAVKVLEYVGLEDFYRFLEYDLQFTPLQDFNHYQLGIALGTLEMSLLDVSHYFTVFAKDGMHTATTAFFNDSCAQGTKISESRVLEEQYVQLVNKILNDRRTGVDQFGLASELNLFQDNYALKTGTSRNFQDSWIVGYTPDFLVGVWLGNADATSTDKLSGQVGAGKIWAQTMELLLHSPYNNKTPFDFSGIKTISDANRIEYGLPGDDIAHYRNVLKAQDTSLILEPHDGDVFLLGKNNVILLKSKKSASWFLNGEALGQGTYLELMLSREGEHRIQAIAEDQQEETIAVFVAE